MNRFPEKIFKSAPSPLEMVIQKCEREMEVKYTKLLTQEFCVGWAKQHLTKNGLQVVLSVNPNPQFDGTRLYELQLEVIEDDVLMPGFRSRLCCLIFALDVELTLKQSLSEGKGVNIFVK